MITQSAQPSTATPTPTMPTLAKRPVFALTVGLGVLLLLGAWFDAGYSGDELYFLAAGHHPAVSYADQPPLIPLLARLMDWLFPGSPAALRIPMVLLAMAGAVLTALLAREFGGGRRAQTLATAAFVASPWTWFEGRWLATATVDATCTALAVLLLVRWRRTGRDGLLLWAGLLTTVWLQAKLLAPLFWLAVGVAALVVGPRTLLTRPLLWLGGLVASACAVPEIVWQAQHGWPQIAMGSGVAAEESILGGRYLFVPVVLAWAGVIVGAFLACHGLYRLLRAPEFARYRFLGWACLGLLVFFLAVQGRNYYIAGWFPLVWAVSATTLARSTPARWWRWVPTWPVYVLSALLPIVLLVPLYPQSVGRWNPVLHGQMGWPGFAQQIGRDYRSLPAADRAHAVVLTRYYPHAGALSRYGHAARLPAVYSGHRGYWYFGHPPRGTTHVLAIGYGRRYLQARFARVRRLGVVRNPSQNPVIDNAAMGPLTVWVASGPREPWPRLWPRLREMR